MSRRQRLTGCAAVLDELRYRFIVLIITLIGCLIGYWFFWHIFPRMFADAMIKAINGPQ